ncbi:MAG: hypothetical protein JSV83_02800 [Desulfobacterales bacterium]|nr:MAG: hypothetical protein JSV83_02800 [Desulfobacterales bacterium]
MDRFQTLDPSCPYPILMPVCSRPYYLRQVLNALSNVKNIDKTLLIISQDGSDPRVTRMIHEIKFTRTIIMRHTRPFLGIISLFWDNMYAVSTNIYFLLSFAFS